MVAEYLCMCVHFTMRLCHMSIDKRADYGGAPLEQYYRSFVYAYFAVVLIASPDCVKAKLSMRRARARVIFGVYGNVER